MEYLTHVIEQECVVNQFLCNPMNSETRNHQTEVKIENLLRLHAQSEAYQSLKFPGNFCFF